MAAATNNLLLTSRTRKGPMRRSIFVALNVLVKVMGRKSRSI